LAIVQTITWGAERFQDGVEDREVLGAGGTVDEKEN
jgi:hypothetical protein